MIEINGGVQVITSGGAIIVELANEGPQGPPGSGLDEDIDGGDADGEFEFAGFADSVFVDEEDFGGA